MNSVLSLPSWPQWAWELPKAIPSHPAFSSTAWTSYYLRMIHSSDPRAIIQPQEEPSAAIINTIYRTFVLVVEDVSAPQPEEHEDPTDTLLSLRAGDILEVLQRSSNDKWRGRRTSDGYYGWFILDERIRPLVGKKLRALFDWIKVGSYGAPFKQGSELEILYRHSSWWYWVKTGKDVALVPFTYVEPIPDEAQTLGSTTQPQSELIMSPYRRQVFQYPAGSTLRCLWPKDYRNPLVLPLKIHEVFEVLRPDMNEEWGLGRTKDGLIGLFAHVLVSSVLEPVLPRCSHLFMRAIVSKRAQSIAEPPLHEDDVVEVLDMRADSYWLNRKTHGETGLFKKEWLRPILDRRMYEDDDPWLD